MPGFFVTNTDKIPELVNYSQNRCIQGKICYKQWTISWNVLNKYQDDKIFLETNSHIIVLDGVILNKTALMKRAESESWAQTVQKLIFEKKTFFEDFRGSFSGAVYEKTKDEWTVFVDQLNSHLVLKYSDGENTAFGSQMNYMSAWMKLNGIARELDPIWQEDILTHGYMLDVHTEISGVERLFPGSWTVCSQTGFGPEMIYYRATKKKQHQVSVQSAIETLDKAFDNAIYRVLNKDIEYGYKTLVDVSGGLDSRMIIGSAYKQAPGQIFCINYAQNGSDDQTIAKKVMNTLGAQGMFFPMDQGRCLLDIDDLVMMNQGLSYYSGITGGKLVLQFIDRMEFGAELFGVLGDVYEGAMISQDMRSEPDWTLERFVESTHCAKKRKYCTARREYEDNELLWFYIRGIFAGMNTALIRQNFCEAITPFGDIEFMEVCFSLPDDMRVREHIYRRWMLQKYPKMAKITYAATGLPVMICDRVEKILMLPRRLYRKIYRRLFNGKAPWEMNPMDTWYKRPEIYQYINQYFNENVDVLKDHPEFKKQVEIQFKNGRMHEKARALTAISAVKQYIL